MNDQPVSQLIEALSYARSALDPAIIEALLRRREEAEPLILQLFIRSFEDEWEDDEDPRWMRFVHAGKLLIAWQNEGALPTFAKLYSSTDEGLDTCENFEDDPVHFGPALIPHFAPILKLDTGGRWHYGKSLAAGILRQIAFYYPEYREEIAAHLRAALPQPDNIPSQIDQMWGDYAANLGQLADEKSRAQILALSEADILFDDFFRLKDYLFTLGEGYEPRKPPAFDLLNEYRQKYQQEKKWLAQIAREEKKRRLRNARPAVIRQTPKAGRNNPCPCGSGKKYKKCCGRPGST